jgi:lysyl endopeptidase
MKQVSQTFARVAVVASVIYMIGVAHAAVTESFNGSVQPTVPGEKRSAAQAVAETQKSVIVERFVGQGKPSFSVALPSVSRSDLSKRLSVHNANKNERKALQLGVGQDVPVSSQKIPLEFLSWETLTDGGRAAKFAIQAAGVAGMRLGYQIDGPSDAVTLRFAAAEGGEVYIGSPIVANQRMWSPTIDGESGVVEIALKAGFEPSQFSLAIDKISQIAVTGADLKAVGSRSPSACPANQSAGIGCAGSCNIDLACVQNPSQALRDAAAATMRISYVESTDGNAYLCSGTLLNSNASPRRPYIFTAAHCVNSQADAASVETYWFFDATSCNSLAIPPFARITTGASLKVADENMDVSLIEMNSNPPSGAVFASWDASVIPRAGTIVGLHHPSGDLKAFSEGAMQGYAIGGSVNPDKGNYIQIRWSAGKGTTEQGSSGSGAFTFNADCGGGVACYQLRGGLEGGAASCTNTSGIDRYSRMDMLFTKLAPYLSPADIIPASNSSTGTMVEYFIPAVDYYFMTSREDEKFALESARDAIGFPIFYRSGFWFKVDPFASPSTNSLTRYAIAGAALGGQRPTHFYTALNNDKQAITGTGRERIGVPPNGCPGIPNGFFCNEGTDSYVATPFGTGAGATCAAGERPIWRVFRGAATAPDDANHRYLTSAGMYNYMVGDQRWSGEFINICARP